MAEHTEISWADSTFDPWIGCTPVSPGCDHCYARAFGKRMGVEWGAGKPRRRTGESTWRQPLAWDRKAGAKGAKCASCGMERGFHGAVLEAPGDPQCEQFVQRQHRVFCGSLCDWLDPEVPAEWLADLLALTAATPHLTWMLLSKRPELWRTRLEAAMRAMSSAGGWGQGWYDQINLWIAADPPHNLWIGATIEDQQRADERIPALLRIPAVKRFLSCEPLLSAVRLPERSAYVEGHPGGQGVGGPTLPGIHWVIASGESGPRARPTHPDWVRGLRDQCQAANVPFFWKSWGKWRPRLASIAGEPEPHYRGNGWGTLRRSGEWFPTAMPFGGRWDDDGPGEVAMVRTGKKAAGCLLDGREHEETP